MFADVVGVQSSSELEKSQSERACVVNNRDVALVRGCSWNAKESRNPAHAGDGWLPGRSGSNSDSLLHRFAFTRSNISSKFQKRIEILWGSDLFSTRPQHGELPLNFVWGSNHSKTNMASQATGLPSGWVRCPISFGNCQRDHVSYTTSSGGPTLQQQEPAVLLQHKHERIEMGTASGHGQRDSQALHGPISHR